jgi:hypothetical protein
MMWIYKTFTKQHTKTALRATFRAVQSMVAYKTSTRRKEQVSVRTSQARQSVKRDTIDGHKDWGGDNLSTTQTP